jgi:hypothetical protein
VEGSLCTRSTCGGFWEAGLEAAPDPRQKSAGACFLCHLRFPTPMNWEEEGVQGVGVDCRVTDQSKSLALG